MAQDNQNGSDQPKYLTHEELNGALAAQRRDFEKMLAKQAEQNKSILDSIQSAFGPKPEAAPLPTKSELAEDTNELKKQLKILMDRDRQRDETEKKMKLETSLRNEVNKQGIRSRDEVAIRFLKDDVSWDSDGQLVMKVDGIPLPLTEAVAKFAQSEHGKFLADPRDVRGSGANNMNAPRSAPTATQQVTNHGGVPLFTDAKALKDYVAGEMGKTNLKY